MSESESLPRVLIVDDEENILNMFQRSLRKDFEVITTAKPSEAIEIMKKQKVDGIIIDFELPEISGSELIKTIRRNMSYDYVPILVLTAHETHMAVTSSFQSGADGFLAKPATVAEVRVKMLELMHSQKFSRSLKQRLSREKYSNKGNSASESSEEIPSVKTEPHPPDQD
jgi:two-component system, cell cycle response regulator